VAGSSPAKGIYYIAERSPSVAPGRARHQTGGNGFDGM
jgi:hypothetical protein